MKTLLCAICREEGDYIREWVEYHLIAGFTKIIIYDNNQDGDKENLLEELKEYIEIGKVTVENFKNKRNCQYDAYNDCLIKHSNEYDWLSFIDIDEFITFDGPGETISTLLSKDCFNDYDCINLRWVLFGDNGKIYKEDGLVTERFLSPTPISRELYEWNLGKCIVRGRINNVYFTGAHTVESIKKEKHCHNDGSPLDKVLDRDFPWMRIYVDKTDESFYKYCYIRHYITKSLEEYIGKIKRGYPDSIDIKNTNIEYRLRKDYFRINEPTEEKIKWLKDNLNLDLSDLLKHKEN